MNYLIEQLDVIIEGKADVMWKKALNRHMTAIQKAIGGKRKPSTNLIDDYNELSRSDVYLKVTSEQVKSAFEAVKKVAKRLKLSEVAGLKTMATYNNYKTKSNPQLMINVNSVKSGSGNQLEIMMTIEGYDK